jgi:hypothetical protein
LDSGKLFNNYTFNDDTDDIDQIQSPREFGSGINSINDTQVPKPAQKETK